MRIRFLSEKVVCRGVLTRFLLADFAERSFQQTRLFSTLDLSVALPDAKIAAQS
jgi:hypothetical protein